MNAPTARKLLILDDDADVGVAARLLLRRHVDEVHALADPRALLAEVERLRPTVLLLDMNFGPGRTGGDEGLALLQQLRARRDAPAVIVMTAYAEVDLAVQALKAGAFDFVTKPWENTRLVATLQAALASRAGAVPAAASPLLGDSAPMQQLRAVIASVAPTEANVLILGENGVGKELVAQALHQASARAGGVFLGVDMGALPETTFESEMFGHRRGSFTDARADRPGRFQAARGGTLFLDEIGNLAPAAQAKLLAALEKREVTPVGADRPEPVDVRIVSATNLPEAELLAPARFRPDLLWRLNTIVLRVPPLRERREDILPLAEHYLRHYARQYAKPPRPLAEAARTLLAQADWPGNVRALRHACERAVILASGPRFEAADFAAAHAAGGPGGALAAAPLDGGRAAAADAVPGTLRLDTREREAVAAALRQVDGNISQAARLLGVSRAALYRKLEKHGL